MGKLSFYDGGLRVWNLQIYWVFMYRRENLIGSINIDNVRIRYSVKGVILARSTAIDETEIYEAALNLYDKLISKHACKTINVQNN